MYWKIFPAAFLGPTNQRMLHQDGAGSLYTEVSLPIPFSFPLTGALAERDLSSTNDTKVSDPLVEISGSIWGPADQRMLHQVGAGSFLTRTFLPTPIFGSVLRGRSRKGPF